MENQSVKKINIAGNIGYVISILLIVCSIAAMVGVAIGTIATAVVSNNEINVKIATNVDISSKGNFINKIIPFVSIDGVDLKNITEEAKDNIKVNDEDISELSIQEQDGGLNIKAKTNEITISMKKITIFLVATFVYLLVVTIALYKIKSLMKSLKTAETPFTPEIIKKMTTFANTLIAVVLARTIHGGFVTLLTSGNKFNLSFDLSSILLVAVIYLLIFVFKYGAELQKESDETV